MRVLVLYFLAGPNMRGTYLDAMRREGVADVVDLCMVLPGPGSARNERYVLDSPGPGTRLERVARRMGALPLDRYELVVLAGFSAGYGAIRSVLDDEASVSKVDAVVSIDAWHDSPGFARLDGLERFARRALAGDSVLWLSHTDVQTPQPPRVNAFASTTQVARELCRRVGVEPPAKNAHIESGGLRIASVDQRPAAQAQGEHGDALTVWGDELLAGAVKAAIDQYRTRSTSPEPLPSLDVPDASMPLHLRLCYWLGWQRGLGVREVPGARHDPRILAYSKHCRRGGRFLGVSAPGVPIWDGGGSTALPRDEDAWCAACRSAALLGSLLPGETPCHGLRVAVWEHVEDARAAGRLHLVGSGYTPKPGDAAVFRRAGQSPLLRGKGHIHTMSQRLDAERYEAYGGNEFNEVHFGRHRFDDPDLEAWIET